ncbi:MAG: Na+/H+ antiporter NhaA [Nostocoides sp.]
MTQTPRTRPILRRPAWAEAQFVAQALRTETIGGAILLAAAASAILWANTPWREVYFTMRDTVIGPTGLHLNLSIGQWAADGALAVFFFVAGLELKREFIVGELNTLAKAIVPVIAAVCGVIVPAIVFVGIVSGWFGDAEAVHGWAIPTATDIAFALAVLAVIGSHLPAALRSFLLTLAVVDDLIAITIIAFFYTEEFHVGPLLLALVPLAAYAFLVQRRVSHWWTLLPLAVLTWALVHASGVHATIAGVLLGLTVPVKPRPAREVPSVATLPADLDVAHHFEHLLRPISAGVAVPMFAFFASGVSIVGDSEGGGLSAAIADPVFFGVILALVLGKFVGVFGGTWITAKLTSASTDDDVHWSDVAGVALLTGIGFTVSLLIGELAFAAGSPREAHVKVAVLAGSVIAALAAAAVLVPRNAAYRAIEEKESRDSDHDGIPDVYTEADASVG